MPKAYVFYNPLARSGHCRETAELLSVAISDELVYCDMTKDETYEKSLFELQEEDYLILCGGDGTLNRFINLTEGLSIPNEILYFPSGSGNDFAHDLGRSFADTPFPISQYIKDLPFVEVNGRRCRFLNGVGYGIDGYCCEIGDKLREESSKPVSYSSIAIKGLLFHYKPTAAHVTVDGIPHSYKKVWLAPTMNGRFYGGGMMPTPGQDRSSADRTLSLMVLHDSGKLKTLMVFPSIFEGRHVQHKEMVDVLTGHDITVEFDRPTALQIDGETISGVTSYHAFYPAAVEEETAAAV